MSRPQLQDSEVVPDIPDKAILATVFNYLKNKNLKETEEALKKELSGLGATNTSALESIQFSCVGQSGIEPLKYEDSYSGLQTPLSTTHSNTSTATATKAEGSPRLDKALSPSNSPIPNDTSSNFLLRDNHQQRQQSQSESNHFSAAQDSPIATEFAMEHEEEEEEMEIMEDDSTNSIASPPRLMTISADAAVTPFSPASSPPSASQNIFGLSKGFVNQSPLWATKKSTCFGPVPASLGVMPSLSGISATTAVPPPVRGCVPQSRPLGLRNVVFQSTPATTGTSMGSTKSMTVHVPMMYQLATPQSLLAPLLTMVPPPASSITASLASAVASLPKLVSTPGIGALMGSKVSAFSMNSNSENISYEKEINVEKKPTEPSTGQILPYSDTCEYGSSCSSPSGSVSTVGSPAPRTLASIPFPELTQEQVELKGFAEEFKTRRIKLGFTQGSVGQSLAEKGYSNFAQSTISRFEQMQLSPSNAATIRVVLEQWLIEAESPESASSVATSGANISMMASRKRKKRAVFTSHTKSTLDTFFLQNPRPNRQAIEEISQQLELLPEEVRVWFCNKRQKSKPGTSSSPVRSLSLGNEASSYNRSSSTTPSPSPSCDGAMGAGLGHILKRRSVSPPHRMPFTIEELSKSSSSSSTYTTTASPMRLMGQSFSPIGLVASDARAKLLPMVFGQHLPMLTNALASPFMFANQIAKTKA